MVFKMNLIAAPLIELTLDDLWREAESLGFVRVWTYTDWGDYKRTGYSVEIKGRIKNTKLEVEAKHSSLHCAFAEVINEAREMGMGAQG